jgi:hypothetical protein
MLGKNLLWVAKQHGHSVQTMLDVYAASHTLADAQCRPIARQSGRQARVNQDDKGSRGVWIMLLLIDAGKH